jgi:hypothetical protein
MPATEKGQPAVCYTPIPADPPEDIFVVKIADTP